MVLINALDRYKSQGVTDVWEARFLIMTEAWMKQTDNIGLCNIRFKKLRDWNTKQFGLENEP